MTANMYQIWLHMSCQNANFRGLLNFVRERILKHVYGYNLLCTALKNQLLFNPLKTQLRRILPSESQYLN